MGSTSSSIPVSQSSFLTAPGPNNLHRHLPTVEGEGRTESPEFEVPIFAASFHKNEISAAFTCEVRFQGLL
jgi:hypothetical protein